MISVKWILWGVSLFGLVSFSGAWAITEKTEVKDKKELLFYKVCISAFATLNMFLCF